MICVAVEFLSQVIFIFLLFLGKVMYTNKVDTKEKIKITRDKKLTTAFATNVLYYKLGFEANLVQYFHQSLEYNA